MSLLRLELCSLTTAAALTQDSFSATQSTQKGWQTNWASVFLIIA